MLKGFILGVITTLFLTGATTLFSINPDVVRDEICKFVNYIFSEGKDLSQKYKYKYKYEQNRDKYYEEEDSF
jgi:hypothetical protein